MYREQKYKVGLVQMSMSANIEENLKRAGEFVTEAAGKGAEIICLPEMFRSQYFCQREDVDLFDLAEPLEGVSFQHLSKIAKDKKVTVIAPIFERRSAVGVFHNSLVVIGENGENVGVYRKMHIPDDPAYYEKFYFTPGDLGFKAFETAKAKIGTLICWDQWYPEGARLTALKGAEVLFYPTAIGWHPFEKEEVGASQQDAWQTIQRSHAIANELYVVSVNRVGHEVFTEGTDGIQFWGHSFVADPFGVVIAQASDDKEEVLVVELDRARTEDVRRNWQFFRDRRIENYGDLQKRFID
ncbi:MAG TPA: carbon-nitrogen hydrolase [Pyrinomonadaceae bacterium]|nr:carbon-nitrogen hydrolase [Pyrinomonadaceae bacterium]